MIKCEYPKDSWSLGYSQHTGLSWRLGMSFDNSTVTYRDIPGWPGYRASDDGHIWSCWNSARVKTGQWHEINTTSTGNYRYVVLFREGRKGRFHVARLILMTFVGPCPPGHQACHFPEKDPKNCSLSNLMWGTHQTNVDHRKLQGGNRKGTQKYNSKVTEDEIREIARLKMEGVPNKEIATRFGLNSAHVTNILKRNKWKHVDIPDGLTKIHRFRTPDEVREIRRLADDGVPQSVIASRMGIDDSIVCRIVNRKAFANIE